LKCSLSDELFKQRNKKIEVIFGKPIPASFFTDEKSDKEWAAYLHELVHNMGRERFGKLNEFVSLTSAHYRSSSTRSAGSLVAS
jgi:hypothetical protein